MIDLLLAREAKVDGRNWSGATVPGVCRDVQAAELLLRHSADVNKETRFRSPPLVIALERGDTGLVRLYYWSSCIGSTALMSEKELCRPDGVTVGSI